MRVGNPQPGEVIAADVHTYRDALFLVRGLDRVDSFAEVCALRGGEQVDVLARAGEEAMRLNGVAAGEREPEV